MKKTTKTILMAAVALLSMAACGGSSATDGNVFAKVAEELHEYMECLQASAQEKADQAMEKAMDLAEQMNGQEIAGETDGDFGLVLKGPFKVFVFNRDNGCFYLQAPAEMDDECRPLYAIGYADDTPVYYIDGAEGEVDEEHLQMATAIDDSGETDDTEYLQVKLTLRPVDAEQLAKVNKIVITQNEALFLKLKNESEQRVAKSIKEAHGGRVDEPVAGELGLFELRGPVKKCVWGRYTLEFDNKGMWVAENGKKPWAEKPNVSRDSQGRITKMAIDYDEEYTQFEYDKNGHIVKRHVHYMDGDDITYYKYDEAGDCLLCQNSYSGMDAEEGDDNRITHYTINKRDEKGNWTERTTSDGTKETRTILYY